MSQRFRLWISLVVCLGSLVPLGCSEETSEEPPSPPGIEDVDYDPDVSEPRIAGLVYRTGGHPTPGGGKLILIADPSSAPAGSEPASGIPVEVVDRGGNTAASGATDSNGEFLLDTPRGFLTLRVDGGTIEKQLSAIAGGTIDAGDEPQLSFKAALQRIRSQFGPDDLVLRTMQPLPGGTIAYPSYYLSDGATVPASQVMRIDESSWFFFVDTVYDAFYGHPVRYVSVNARTGAVEVSNANWPPAINHQPSWETSTDYLDFTGVDPLDFDPDDIPKDADYTTGAEVVQLPDELTFRRAGNRLSEWLPSGQNNSDTFVIAISGGKSMGFKVNTREVRSWFLSKGVPDSQIEAIDMTIFGPVAPGNSQYKRAFDAFNQTIKDRLENENRESTLVIWISSHSSVDANEIVMTSFLGTNVFWKPSDFCLPESRACKLRVLLDTCFADRFAPALAGKLGDHDYRIVGACKADQLSHFTSLEGYLERGLRTGGRFTNAVFDTGNFDGNDFTGLYPKADGDILTDHPVGELQTAQIRSKTQIPSWCTDPSVIGVCCLPDGRCLPVLRESDCDGELRRGVTSCDPNPCPQPGACCFAESCLILVEEDCENVSGSFQGAGTNCDPNLCPGACCLPDHSCLLLALKDCEAVSGTFHGVTSACTPDPCVRTGACCSDDGQCAEVRGADNCSEGEYEGDDSTCDPNPCPQPGACCLHDGSCSISLEADCDVEFMGGGTNCDPNPCPQPGPCCFETGECDVLSPAQCVNQDGDFQGSGGVCDPNPCPQPPEGACCWGVSDEQCAIRSEHRCTRELGGSYLGDGTTCFSEPCTDPLAGACCLTTGRCEYLREASCIGEFMGIRVTCSPGLCDPPEEGACCFAGGACSLLSLADCTNADGDYRGSGTVCDPNPCVAPVGACCVEELCSVVEESLCDGVYIGDGSICEDDTCVDTSSGACCIGVACTIATEALCDGEYQGDDTSCDPDPCAKGACCVGEACQVLAPKECDGEYRGDGSICDPNPCASGVGACCIEDECVLREGPENCQDGTWLGIDSACAPDICKEGACCVELDCVITFGFDCDGEFLPGVTECEELTCEKTGACCTASGGCTVLKPTICRQMLQGWFMGEDTVCDPSPCTDAGACCLLESCFAVVDEADCAGVYWGVGTACPPEGGCPTGVCCTFDDCTPMVPQMCDGEYFFDTTCDPRPCDGACCTNTSKGCAIRSAFACQAEFGTFLGYGTVCDPDPCIPTGACCTADGCAVLTENDCFPDVYLGDGEDCEGVPCLVGACCVGTECELVVGFEGCSGEYLGDGSLCDPEICFWIAGVEKTRFGVIHGRGSSDLCLTIDFDGDVEGATATVEFTGVTNPGTELAVIDGNGHAQFSRGISLYGNYSWALESVASRDRVYQVNGTTSGEITVDENDVPCER